MVSIASASLLAFAVVAVAGTVVGYVVSLVSLMTIGPRFENQTISPRAAALVYWTLILSGVPAAFVVALLVSGYLAR